MADGISGRIGAALERFRSSMGGRVSIGLADANGLPIAFAGPAGDGEAATAMAALLVSAAERATQILRLPPPQDLVIGAGGATVLVRPVGQRLTLLAILDGTADLGRVRALVQTCSDDLRILFEGT